MKNNKQFTGDLGQHWTPFDTVDRMISLMKNKGTILEPSVGSGRFLSRLPNADGCEIDKSVLDFDNGNITIGNFFDYSLENKYDTIIGNPPYVQGRLLEPSWFGEWKGKLPATANAYFHFIEKCLSHLNPGGELIFIVPATLLSGSSLGSKLRNMMMDLGTFTDVIYEDTKWEKAAIDTVIFRYELGLQSNVVNVDGKEKHLVHSDGFIWTIDYESTGSFGDYFNFAVGSAPLKNDIHDKGKTGFYFADGNMIAVDETNIEKWPRKRNTPKGPKIFYRSGPTRRWPNFWPGDAEKHLSHCMIPNQKIDIEKASVAINEWFRNNGESLGLISGGRWGAGVKQLSTIPFPNELLYLLSNYIEEIKITDFAGE